jgi:hypothetical protein
VTGRRTILQDLTHSELAGDSDKVQGGELAKVVDPSEELRLVASERERRGASNMKRKMNL